MRKRDVDARMIELGDAAGSRCRSRAPSPDPTRARAHEEKRQRKVLAAGAHGGAAPYIHHQRARPVAVILEVAAEQFLGRLLGEHERRAASARRADRWRRDCGPWAARRRGRASARPTDPGPRICRRARRAALRARSGGLIEARDERVGGYLRVGLRQRGEELFAAMRVGRAAINMQPIPDLQVLDITEISVEAGELVLLRRGAVGAALGEQAGGPGAVEESPRGAAPCGGGRDRRRRRIRR